MSEIRDPTTDPIPDGDRYVAGVLTALGIEPYMSGGKWRFEITEEQMMALATRLFTDGRGAGRSAAAEDIRAEIVDEPTHENLRMMNAAFALAARVAEGADQ